MKTELRPTKNGYVVCYKFRGIRTDSKQSTKTDFDHIKDILNGYLFCSDWREQNDVLEGLYFYRKPGATKERLILGNGKRLQKQKMAYRVCSLTTDYKHPLMWAFYASNNTGVAIEIRLPFSNSDIFPVEYDKTIPVMELEDISSDVDGSFALKTAQYILTHKTIIWKYENEVRILAKDSRLLNNNRYKIAKPTKLYYGPRMSGDVYNKLQEICDSLDHRVEIIPIALECERQFGKHYDFVKEDFVDS